jgi:hypothetical protein
MRGISAGLPAARFTARRARQWSWFCSYCAAQPATGTRPLSPTRVCEHCGLGILLEAPADAAPAAEEAFLVLDEELVVRALSIRAEQVLAIREPDAVGQPIDSLLPHTAQSQRLALSVKRAADGDDAVRHATVRLGKQSGDRTGARIACCGPPAAALVVLESHPVRASQ